MSTHATDPMYTDRDTDDDVEYMQVDNGVLISAQDVAANPLRVTLIAAVILTMLTVGFTCASNAAQAWAVGA